MGYTGAANSDLFQSLAQDDKPILSPPELRLRAMQEGPAERSRFIKEVYVETEQFKFSFNFISNLIERSQRSDTPGGLWLIGEGGTGKSYLLERIQAKYPPIETEYARTVPVLIISLNEQTSESSILISMLLQLGQDPELLHFKNNDDLKLQVIDAMKTTHTRAVLFDESHYIWLKPNGKVRSADRSGGTIGGFLLRFYDLTGVAMVFAGTPGLESVLQLNDKQSSTRWEGRIRLNEFQFDERFGGLLGALNQALPFPEPSNLTEEDRARKIYLATKGNFRSLKNFLAQAVYIAAADGATHIHDNHLFQAFQDTYGLESNPFA
jgi:hypothetical protein